MRSDVLIFTTICIAFQFLLPTIAQSNVIVDVTETQILMFWDVDNKTQELYNVTINPSADKNALVMYSGLSQLGRSNMTFQSPPGGLSPGVKYDVKLKNGNTGEILYNSTHTTKPMPPENVEITQRGTTYLEIAWKTNPSSTQDKFMVIFSNMSNIGGVDYRHFDGPDETFNLTGLYPGREYRIHMIAFSNEASSNTTDDMIENPAPLPPINVQIEAVDTSSLSISADQDPNGEQDGFAVAYKLDGSSVAKLAPCNQSRCIFQTTGLPGQKYIVSIVSVRNKIISSEEIVFHNTVPLPVTYIEFVGSSASSLNVSWNEPAGSKLTGYRVEVYDGVDKIAFSNVSSDRFYEATGLGPGKEYNISIIVLTETEESIPFSKQSFTNPDPPIFTTIVPTTDSFTISWDAPSGSVEKYVIGIRYPAGTALLDKREALKPPVSFGNLTAGTSYIILGGSINAGKQSVVVDKTATTRPNPVTSMRKAVSGTDFINVTWEQPLGEFDEYKLTITPEPLNSSPSEVLFPKSSNILEYGFSSLHPGFMYHFTIVTIKDGIESPTFVKQFLTYPLPVTDLEVSGISITELDASWNINISSGCDSFYVWYSAADNPLSVVNSSEPIMPNKISYSKILDGLYPGKTYNVTVIAVRLIGTDRTVSEERSASGTVYPKPVENLQLNPFGKYGFVVNWDKQNDSIQDQFLVEYRPVLRNPTSTWIQNFTTTDKMSITISQLFPGEKYEIAVYSVSVGQKSTNVTRNRILEPLPPAEIRINQQKVTTDSVTIGWSFDSNVTNVDKWRILYHKVGDALLQDKFVDNSGASKIEVEISSLSAGEHYEVEVYSKVLDISSEAPANITITARPTIETNMLEDTSLTTTDSIALTYSEAFNKFDYLKFYPSSEPTKFVIKNKEDSDRRVLIKELIGGTLYDVQVVAVSGEQASETKKIEILTVPNNPVVEVKAKTRSILMNVTRPEGSIDYTTVTCVNTKTGEVAVNITHSMSDTRPLVFPDLRPYTRYTITFISYRLHKHNKLVIEERTLEDAPTEVLNVKSVESRRITVTLTWDEPDELNGELLMYNVKYIGTFTGKQPDSGEVNVTKGRTVDITNLKAGFIYTFNVRAITVAVGKPGNTTITMRTYPPTFKEEIPASNRTPVVIRTPDAVTPTTISVLLHNVFSDKFGDIQTYTVIVSKENNVAHLNKTVLPGWKAAQNDPAVKAYQVIQNCSRLFMSDSSCDGRKNIVKRSVVDEVDKKTFEIGIVTDCKSETYCNGPLKPNTDYYVVLRAYSTMGFKDTPFSAKINTHTTPDETSSAGVIGGVIGALLCILIIVAVVVFILRRRRHGNRKQMYRSDPTENQMTPRSSTRKVKSSRRIKLSDFKDHVKLMSADSDFRYADEFEDLKKVGKENTCHAAEIPVNRGKNRFTNVLPYDHSRVKLHQTDDEDGTDYINANYISGHNSKREYIVTQGPLHSTRDDFWRMIWEQNCQNVVMLTRCKEKGREKCDRYWPEDSEALFYGDLQVAILNETRFPEWCITEFRVALGNKTRQIRHFHYTAWPDFGVPERPQSLIRFVRTVRSKLIKEAGPIIVHCSAGVGRSGTFISLDRLLQHIIEHDYADIYGIVHEMRKDRMSMVQLEQQYICIHQCLLCVLEGREDEDPVYHNIGIENRAFEDDEGINVEI